MRPLQFGVGCAFLALMAQPALSGLVIEHDAVTCMMARAYPRIAACAAPEAVTSHAQVHFRATPSDPWYTVDLAPDGPCLSTMLPRPLGTPAEIEYYLWVGSPSSEARLPATAPAQTFHVKVVERADQCSGSPAAFATVATAPVKVSLVPGAARGVAALTGFVRDEVATTFEMAATPARSQPRPTAPAARTAVAAPAEPPPAAFPACYLQNAAGASRFADAAYFRLMLGDGLRSAPPRALSERTRAAADAGEAYKALFLARLLCDVSPQTPGVWSNRATVAEALGLSREAAASRQRAQDPNAAPPPHEVLPGPAVAKRPKSLADWAAALSLMADAMEATEGRAGLAVVKDTVSGVEPVKTRQPTGKEDVWAQAVPIKVDDVIPNLFALHDAKAMGQKGTNWAALAVGTAMAVGASSANARTALDVEVFTHVSNVAGQILGEAFAIDSQWKKGSYTARTFAGGAPRDQTLAPRSAGESTAVDLPVPVLIASGGALRPAVLARWGDHKGNPAKGYEYRFTPGRQPLSEVKVPDLWYPRLALLGFAKEVEARPQDGWLLPTTAQAVQTSATALELLLSREDVEALAPDAAGAAFSRMPDVREAAEAYAREDPRLTLSYANALVQLEHGRVPMLMGFDASGACYALRVKPGAWLMPQPPARR